MSTFWVKIAIFAVIVVGIIVLINVFPKPQQKAETESFYDVAAEDDARLRAEPQFKEPPEIEQPPEKKPSAAKKTPEPQREVEPTKPKFRELSEIEKVDAEKLLNTAIQHRKIGRLPTTGYKVMVDCCRELIRKYPDSVYAFKAKRMLADIPKRFRRRYKITEEEIDLGNLK